MLQFKQFLSESDLIKYHIDKTPKHEEFIHRFLGVDKNQRQTRSKYLNWVMNTLDKTDTSKVGQKKKEKPDRLSKFEHADLLGKYIDYFNNSKHDKDFKGHRDITRYGNHHDFINSMHDIEKGLIGKNVHKKQTRKYPNTEEHLGRIMKKIFGK